MTLTQTVLAMIVTIIICLGIVIYSIINNNYFYDNEME
jgi:hypothetical protein